MASFPAATDEPAVFAYYVDNCRDAPSTPWRKLFVGNYSVKSTPKLPHRRMVEVPVARDCRSRIIFSLILALALAVPGGTAIAQEDDVDVVEINRGSDVLTLEFDEPISESEAEDIRQRFGDELGGQVRQQQVVPIGCKSNIDPYDENNTLTLQFQCFPEYGVVN